MTLDPSIPKVSVVIPTFNAGSGFETLMKMLASQETPFGYEVLVVDSSSTDSTVEVAKKYGARVHTIPKSSFNHGATRNLGISLSQGEYVALLVQDAQPVDGLWLAAMVENLERDELVAGVYSRQIPRPECRPLTRVVVNERATASLERREQFVDDPKRYREMPPRSRRRLAVFDNVSSCLRRSLWEELPFKKVSFGEDLWWSKKAIEAGYKIVYEPRSAVFHSHERGAMYDLRRHYVNQLTLMELFELALVPNLGFLLLGIPRSSLRLYRHLRRDGEVHEGALKLMLLALRYSVAAQLGTYLGARYKSLARLSPRLHARLHRFLSRGV